MKVYARHLHWHWFWQPVRGIKLWWHTRAVQKFLNKLAANQRELPPDAAKVLHDNLWDLYESEPAAVPLKPVMHFHPGYTSDQPMRKLHLVGDVGQPSPTFLFPPKTEKNRIH